ncbi:hypothetical protein [Candidatus Phycosocius spiralis]|uniref:Uncharacterized protein n=1 Tax=Candidatus Phycosocius spiralis TaxID=2815099 RepID=A0ABQ4PUE8_9PROT|nr:hypothetical protein [Candidatus Phycosocius spiralis]GIU66560.1 hypothetical protein PsB1_0714 [Candidatus Phycosocius spiralis]
MRTAFGVDVPLNILANGMVPCYAHAESIINLLQHLNGLAFMPILAAFVVGLLFRYVDARAAIAADLFGIGFCGLLSFEWQPYGLHYIHLQAINLFLTIGVALAINRYGFCKLATLVRMCTKEGRASLILEDLDVMQAEK